MMTASLMSTGRVKSDLSEFRDRFSLTETAEGFDPLLAASTAFLLAQFAPGTNLHVVRRLHNICDVSLRVDL